MSTNAAAKESKKMRDSGRVSVAVWVRDTGRVRVGAWVRVRVRFNVKVRD